MVYGNHVKDTNNKNKKISLFNTGYIEMKLYLNKINLNVVFRLEPGISVTASAN